MKLKVAAAASLAQILSGGVVPLTAAASNLRSASDLDRRLQDCSSYLPVNYNQVYSTTNVQWSNSIGGDTEWMNVNNWYYGELPGTTRHNKVIMASNDVGSVSCDAVYMNFPPDLELRASTARLDVSANLRLDRVIVRTGSRFTQSSSSSVTVDKNLQIAANYDISDSASLSINLDLYAASNAKLTITGDSTSIVASVETPVHSQLHGLTTYILGAEGTGVFDVGGPLTIGSTSASLSIDASSYIGGNKSIPLVKALSVTGSYSPSRITISGLAAGLVGAVVHRADGVYLDISGGSDPVTTTTQAPPSTTTTSTSQSTSTTSAATTTTTHATTTSEATTTTSTQDPSTTTTTSQATTTQQATTSTTSATTTATDATTTTPEPTTIATTTSGTTTTSTTTSSSTTDPPNDDSQTLIRLHGSGFDPITSSPLICPPPETTSIVIDGNDYTAGQATIPLYLCSLPDTSYDLMKFKLINFPEGLWFDLQFESNSVDLVIKDLFDYREYWIHVRNSYVHEEYPEQVDTEHFPDFSWDTVPTWIRFRKNPSNIPERNRKPWNFNAGDLKDNEIESIAKNNFLSWYGLNTPDHVVATWERIKSVPTMNHRHKSIYYWNAESYWGVDGLGIEQEFIREGAVGTNGRKLYDHENPRMREWWLAHGLQMANNPSGDGVFTDNTMSRECDNGVGCLETTPKSVMIKDLAESVPDDRLVMGNYLRQMIDTGNRFRMPYVDGSYFEGTHWSPGNQPDLEGIIVSMQLAREASWKKKVVMWTGSRRNCGCGFNSPVKPFCPTEVSYNWCIPQYCQGFVQQTEEPTAKLERDFEFALAEFLMIVEKWSYANFSISPDASCERWFWDWSHLPMYKKPLGPPLGPPLKHTKYDHRGHPITHTFSRHFEHLSVKVVMYLTSFAESSTKVNGDVTFIFNDGSTSSPTPNPTSSPTQPAPAGLVAIPTCVGGLYKCFQNSDYGEVTSSGWKLDLQLETLDSANVDAYVAAKDKWESLIVSDSHPALDGSLLDEEYNDCQSPYPASLEGLYICGRDEVIDGAFGVLGYAGVSYFYDVGVDGEGTGATLTGYAVFDVDDITSMVNDGTWTGVILHEIGHVIGIGTMWEGTTMWGLEYEGFVSGSPLQGYSYNGPAGLNVWQNEWGCSGMPPVETEGGSGTAGGHWDEDCLTTELMTGWANSVMPASRLTAATLDDLGYTVDYNSPFIDQTYDSSNLAPGCCNGRRLGRQEKKNKRPLSAGGLKKAQEYGKKVLRKKQLPPGQVRKKGEALYVGDQATTVYYQEEGEIYDIKVTT